MTYNNENRQGAPDRPALEIGVTPERIAAGRRRLFEYDPDFDNEDEIVRMI